MMLQDIYEVQLSGRKLKSDQILLDWNLLLPTHVLIIQRDMPLDRIGFCDSYCCEKVKERCGFTCSFSLKAELSNEPCLHPGGHPELTREEMEKPRLLEEMINLLCLGLFPQRIWTAKESKHY